MNADKICWGFNFSLGVKTSYFRCSQVVCAVAFSYWGLRVLLSVQWE